MGQTTWTQQQFNYCLKSWRAGISASKIAEAVNNKFGTTYTRNSVISKMHREGESNRTYMPNKKPSKPLKIKKKKGVVHRVKLMDAAPDQCRYSVDDGGKDMMVCGAKILHGYKYCRDCCNIVYQKFKEKRKDEK